MKVVQFYFDPISPYVWLAYHQLYRIKEKFEVQFDYIPVLFAGLLNAHQNKGPAEIPAKRVHTLTDTMRWALYYGLEYKSPPAHPFNPLKPLRVCLAVDDAAKKEKVVGDLLDATWSKGLDITQESTLLALLKVHDLDAAAILQKAESPEIKQVLRDNTERAIQRGVFGVPTFIVDQELFWGHDRLLLLDRYLEGELAINKDYLEELLQRPRAADRPQR